jgi:hypothetical protein
MAVCEGIAGTVGGTQSELFPFLTQSPYVNTGVQRKLQTGVIPSAL